MDGELFELEQGSWVFKFLSGRAFEIDCLALMVAASFVRNEQRYSEQQETASNSAAI